MLDIDVLQISDTSTINDAFRQLNANKAGILFVVDASAKVIGTVTDGDLRCDLVENRDTESTIYACMNREFVSVPQDAPREQVLKLLDHRIRLVPALDARGRLRDVITRERFALESERRVFTRSRAPVRISFGGGGTDLTHHFVEHGSVV